MLLSILESYYLLIDYNISGHCYLSNK